MFSVLYYGAVALTPTGASSKKLEAFEMLRYIMDDYVTNREVLSRMKKDREVLDIVKIKKLQYLGYIMRNPNC